MRLEPVYLLAPKKTPPTRRAFLVFAGGFAGGALLGGACGYSLGAMGSAGGAAAASGGAEAAKGEELPSSGDARLDALRRLAVKAPIEELVANWNPFCASFVFDYFKDPVLWRGADRLVAWALANPSATDVSMLNTLLQVVRGDARTGTESLRGQEQALRRLRSERSK
jgi:hypothetical protein